jgi:nitronate monooxygenase
VPRFLFGLVPLPIVLAPMGGAPGTPALAAAVSEAGGLGFLAGGYKTASALREEIAELRRATDRPFGVNVFVPQRAPVSGTTVEAYVASLARAGYEPGKPTWDDDDWDAKLAALVDERPRVVSFTFGLPPADVIAALQDLDMRVILTVTTADEVDAAAAVSPDALCLQGFEAGAHRGSFDDTRDAANDVGLLALLAAARERVELPLIASGGLMHGRDIAAVLVGGAHAAQLGTAFLRSPEAGTHPVHRAALDSPSSRDTAITRAFSGRRARGIVNRFMVEHPDTPSAYPQVNNATRPIRNSAGDRGDAGAMSLWAGQGFRAGRAMPAGELVAALIDECRAALAGAPGLV